MRLKIVKKMNYEISTNARCAICVRMRHSDANIVIFLCRFVSDIECGGCSLAATLEQKVEPCWESRVVTEWVDKLCDWAKDLWERAKEAWEKANKKLEEWKQKVKKAWERYKDIKAILETIKDMVKMLRENLKKLKE